MDAKIAAERASRCRALSDLIDAGLTFADVLDVFAARRTPDEQALVDRAMLDHRVSDELEVDSNAMVSTAADGEAREGFVMAWLWIGPEDDKEES